MKQLLFISPITRILLSISLLLSFTAIGQVPTISSVSPNTGTNGTSVTISGSNFNTTASNNIVYFGATKATVSSATSTSLSVTVPVGCTIDRVSVNNTASNLIGYAEYPFLPEFNNSKFSRLFNYSPVVTFSSTIGPGGGALGDMDGDGKMDVILCDANGGKISVYRNKATAGVISPGSTFTKVDSVTGTSIHCNPISVAVGDMDGDGKLDMVVANSASATMAVFRNTSSGSGVISFAQRQDLSVSGCPAAVSLTDLDGDGKPDIVVALGCNSYVAVYHNTSTLGSVSFASVQYFLTIGGGKSIAYLTTADIDGDGKQDVIACTNDSNAISILHNSSTSGSISFDSRTTFVCGTSPKFVVAGDFDGDGKMDIVTANTTAKTVSVFRNTASSGSITSSSLASHVDFSVPNVPNGITVSDVEANGKLDIAVSNGGDIGILRNTSSSGSITSSSFANLVNLTGPNTMTCVLSGDIDGDGKHDLFGGDFGGNSLVVFKNTPLYLITGPTTACLGTNITLTDSTVSGTWASSNTAVATVVSGGTTTVATTVTPVSAGTTVISYYTNFDTVRYTVTVAALPTAYTVSGGGTGCSTSGVTINLSSSDTGISYQLKSGSTNIGNAVAGTGSAISFTVNASGTYTVVATNATGCSKTMAGSATATITTVPTTFTITGGGQYCPTSTGVAIGLNGSQSSSVTYNLLLGSTVVSTKTGTNASISFGSSFSTLGTYTVQAVSGACTVNMSGSASVIADTTKPVVNTKNITAYLGSSGTVTITPSQVDNGSTDNCTISTRTLDISSFNSSNEGVNTVTLTVTDNSGNSSSATATVMVADTTRPIVLTQNITAYLNASGNVSITPAQIDNGSTDNVAISSTTLNINSFTNANLGANTVTLTVTDNSGNSATGTAAVTVADTIRPVVHTQNVTVYLDPSGHASVAASQVDNGSTDNISIASESVSPNSFTASNLGNNNVTLTVTDGSGNSSTGTATVTVADTTRPVVSTKNVTVYLDATGHAGVSTSQVDNGSTDNGGIASESVSPNSFTASNLGSNNVTLTVTDGSGNSSTGTATVTVADTTRPVVSTKNVTVYLDATGHAGVSTSQVDNGSTDNGGIASESVSPNSFTASNLGSNNVTLTVTDGSGNSSTGTAIVTVADTTRPVVSTKNVTVYLDATGHAGVSTSQVDNGSTDNGGIASESVSPNSFTASNLGSNNVTLTVTDGSGNSSTGTATVTVADTTRPVVSTKNVTVYLDATGHASVAASQVDNGSTDNGGIASESVSPNSFTASNLGSNNVTLTVTDGSGNSSTGTATVTVADTTRPVVSTKNVTVYLDATGHAGVSTSQVDNGSTDNGGIASESVSPNSFTASNLGSNNVTLTVTDGSGNSSTGTATVTVADTTRPVVHTHNVTVYLDATGHASVTASQVDNGSTDNGGIASESVSPSSFTASNLGSNNVTLTVTDGSGNSATGTATVTVADTTRPVVSTKNVTVYLDATGHAGVSTSQVDNGSTDNGGIASESVSPNSFTASNLGSNNVTLTVTDGSGNSSTGTATVTVADTTRPVVHTHNVTVYLDATGHASVTASQVDNGSTDNGGIASESVSPSSFTASNLGSNTVTLTVTDGSGNSSAGIASVTVADTTKPVVRTKNATIYLNASGVATLSSSDVNNGSTDNGGIASISLSKSSFNCANLGTNIVTVTVTDNSGNVSTGTASVTITDNIAPSITCPAAITVSSGATSPATTGTATATDNCTSSPVITYSDIVSSGVITRTWKATDASGNYSTCTQTITVNSISATASITQVACKYDGNGDKDDSTGAISLTVTGGIGSLRYSWSNHKTTKNITGLDTGTYSVTITDSLGSTYTGSWRLVAPTKLSLSGTVVDATCNSSSTGSVTSIITGGTSPIVYSWSTGQTTSSITGLAAAHYTLTITDAHGCQMHQDFEVHQPTAINLTGTATNVSCNSGNNGSINISVSGGVTGYTYSWSSSATTQNISGLVAGTYNVTVTDGKGCTKTGSYSVTQPVAISVTAVQTNVACKAGNTGELNLTVTGGTAGYNFTWNNGKHDQDLKNLTAGAYSVTITDHNGCTKTTSYTVTEPASALSAGISVSPVYTVPTYGAAYTIYLGYGRQTDSLITTASGGTSPYSYSWSPASTVSSTTTTATKITPTSTTNYSVTVTDAHGCTVTKTQSITVVDVRCGDGDADDHNHKITICQVNNGHTHDICVDSSAVAGHLASGDHLGSCESEDDDDRIVGNNQPEAFLIKVFPNPNTGKFSVRVPVVKGSAQIQVIDMTGKLIDSKTITDGTMSQEVEFNMSDAVRGLYFIKVIANDKAYIEKVMIQ